MKIRHYWALYLAKENRFWMTGNNQRDQFSIVPLLYKTKPKMDKNSMCYREGFRPTKIDIKISTKGKS